MAFMLIVIFSQFDVSLATKIMFFLGEGMFIVFGGLADLEEK
jgi:hypothetical protein